MPYIFAKGCPCHTMVKPVAFQNKSVRKMLPVIFAFFGFMTGVVVYACLGGALFDVPSPEMTSAFEADAAIYTLFSCFGREMRYALIICLLGFCFFGEVAGLFALAFKAGLTGFSAAYIFAGAYSVKIYLIHTLSSLTALVFLCCICKISGDFSAKYICQKNSPSSSEILSYISKCLFYLGAIFFSVLIRHLLLALI